MDSGLKKISNIFKGETIFQIPQYQRSYSWGSRQLQDFYDDIYYHKKGRKYYFGTLLLKESPKDGDFEVFEVVDGQQRLTTITIFINIIIYLLKKKGTQKDTELFYTRYIKTFKRHKLKLINEHDSTFLQTYILNVEAETNVFKAPSQKRLYDAKKYFLEKLSLLASTDLETILDKLDEDAETLVYSVALSAEASLIFETTNDRGKDLTNLEKIKSFLMYKAVTASDNNNSNDLVDRIFSRFGNIYAQIELLKPQIDENGINSVTEDQITQYHFISFFEWENKWEYQDYLWSIKNHLNKLYNENKYEEMELFIEEYTCDLEDVFSKFREMLTNPVQEFSEIAYLGRIAVLFPLMLKAYRYDNSEGRSKYNKIMTLLAKYAYRVFALKSKRTNDVDMALSTLSRNFEGDYAALEIQISKRMIYDCPEESFRKKLSSDNFYNEYGHREKIYLLWKYENYLRTSTTPAYGPLGVNTLYEQEERLKYSTEHINAKAAEYNLLTEEETEEFREMYLNHLGNLVLDSKSANSSKGSNEWIIKQRDFFSNAPIKSQNLLKNYLSGPTWDSRAVEKRFHDMLLFAMNEWNGVTIDITPEENPIIIQNQ